VKLGTVFTLSVNVHEASSTCLSWWRLASQLWSSVWDY